MKAKKRKPVYKPKWTATKKTKKPKGKKMAKIEYADEPEPEKPAKKEKEPKESKEPKKPTPKKIGLHNGVPSWHQYQCHCGVEHGEQTSAPQEEKGCENHPDKEKSSQ